MTTRTTTRTSLVALAFSALIGAAALAPAPALAWGGHGGHGGGHGGHGGGFGHGGHWGHGGGFGYRRIGFYGVGYGGCVVRRFITEDGELIVRRRCY
jgi:hypothetical protein